ncbi:MAG: ABC transporter substrate-binding protein [Lachnospiraceae bacterium]|nr:ABC transporter substrate-binding protein [Lachnospiraceae bacterium]
MKKYGKHITKGKIRLARLAIFTILLLAGCGISKVEAGETTGSTESAVEYERVIALSGSNAELWILAGGKLIATSEDALEIEGLNEDVISLGDMDKVSLEAITALEPDLLILFSTDPSQKALGEEAEAVGINVYYTNIDCFADYETVMKDLTGYSGHPENYQKNVVDVRTRIDEVLGKVPEGAEGKTYLLLHVSATKSKVEKNDYFACEIFNDLGLYNIASDDSSLDELSLEAIVAADPDYIFLVPRGNEKKALESFEHLFTSQPAWSSLSAVSGERFYLLSKELFGLKPNAAWGESYSAAYDLLYR